MRRTLLLALAASLAALRIFAATCSPSLFVQAASYPAGGRATAVTVAFIELWRLQ